MKTNTYFQFGQLGIFGREFGQLLVVSARRADDPLFRFRVRGELRANLMQITVKTIAIATTGHQICGNLYLPNALSNHRRFSGSEFIRENWSITSISGGYREYEWEFARRDGSLRINKVALI